MTVISGGKPHPNLPYRYGCSCGAVWNASSELKGTETLCGPFCKPRLFKLDESAH